MASPRTWMQELSDGSDAASGVVRQATRHAHAETTAFTPQLPDVLDDMRRRLDRLEEQGALSTAAAKEDRHMNSRGKLKKLEDQLKEKVDLPSAHALALEEDRRMMGSEILRLTAQLEEHKAANANL